MNSREQILKLLKQNQTNKTPLPKIDTTALLDVDLVEKFKFEFERVGGIFIKTAFNRIFDEISKIITTENLRKIYAENFDNEINTIIKNLQVDEIITQPHSYRQISIVDASITSCDFLIAETGTIVFIHRDEKFKSAVLLPRVHIIIAKEKQIVGTLEEVFSISGGNFDSIFLITGPSRTADIEKVIVQGVHGPQKVYLIIV